MEMTLKDFNQDSGWATITYQGADYVVYMADFADMAAVKAFVLDQASQMQPDPKPAFVPKEGTTF